MRKAYYTERFIIQTPPRTGSTRRIVSAKTSELIVSSVLMMKAVAKTEWRSEREAGGSNVLKGKL